jgi:uncharacterized protein
MAHWCPGRFVWWELYTPDVAKSAAFYSGLFGWTVAPVTVGSIEYTMIKLGDTGIGGMAPLSIVKMAGARPFWMSFVSAADVDASAAAARAGGGRVLVEPVDMPPVGRFAVVLDPQGAGLSLFKASAGDPPEVERPAAGAVCWTELYTTDLAAAQDFYGRVLGWKTAPGKAGMPVFLRGDRPAASLVAAPPGVPPNWLNYVLVMDLDAACAKASALGGTVAHREAAAGGMGRLAVVLDDVGAVIALFEPAAGGA